MFSVQTNFQAVQQPARRHRSLALILLGCALAGCASRNVGYRISNETVEFIQPGVTARSEVVDNLGPPLIEIQNPHVVAYSWGKVRSGVNAPAGPQDQPVVMPGNSTYATPPPPPPMSDTAGTETERWIFCIALDAKDRVQRVGRLQLQGSGSLVNAVRQWAAQGGPSGGQ